VLPVPAAAGGIFFSEMELDNITDDLLDDLRPLRFGPPVTHVYNPLEYARKPYRKYIHRFARPPKKVILLGMNPGPWGMAQTGIPFGEINAVKEWLAVEAPIGVPANIHPKRPVKGFACTRSEVSGKRLWGWARKKFKTPERFFAQFLVINYCPLLFIETGGRNWTPNKLRASERQPLLTACDRALRRTVELMQPEFVMGVGQFAEERARVALAGLEVTVGAITHPSPANPRANCGWEALITKELATMGIHIR
jgi:single-strand selective monofunctional uracil DNA glycosylase